MIKSEKSGASANKSYPKLMVGKDSKNVVLMLRSGIGTVVFIGEGNKTYSLGEHSNSFNMTAWTDYGGTISLSNKDE